MIKASHIVETIERLRPLNERNIVNVQEVDRYIDEFVRGTDKPEIKRWFKTRLRKFILNDFEGTYEVSADHAYDNYGDEPWVVDLVKSGETEFEIIDFDNDEALDLNDDLGHVLDYFTYVLDHPREVPREFRINDITRISVSDAIEKSLDWTEWLVRQGAGTGSKDDSTEVLSLSGGYKWVQLSSQAALDYEGSEMGHCVGSYGDKVSANQCRIFSLRDQSNKPHVTVEVTNGGEVYQVQGKGNWAPVEKYWDAIIAFFNWGLKEGYFTRIRNLEQFEAVLYKGKVYTEKDAPKEVLGGIYLNRAYEDDFDLERMERLLKEGADPDSTAKNSSELTLLMKAATNHHYRVVDLLLKYGADVNKEDSQGKTALYHCMTGYGSYRMLSAESDIIKTADTLISHGSDVNKKSKTGATILAEVCARGFSSAREVKVNYLINKGATPNIIGFDGQPLLVQMIRYEDIDSAEIALNHGADPNMRSTDGRSALHWTVNMKRIDTDLFNAVLKAGADVNAADKHGWTPLICALMRQAPNAIIIGLLKAGADPNLGPEKYKPMKLAQGNPIRVLLMEYGGED
jgi:ankyrin repeat protein